MIDDIITELEHKTKKTGIFFDSSRLWTLAYKDKSGDYYGVQRHYLGGGVRGSIVSNLKNERTRKLFTQALQDIENEINSDCGDCESWEKNTGVLL